MLLLRLEINLCYFTGWGFRWGVLEISIKGLGAVCGFRGWDEACLEFFGWIYVGTWEWRREEEESGYCVE